MVRILVYVAILFAAAAGFAWLADRPGEIALAWQGYEIRTSLMVGAVAVAVAFVVLALMLSILMAVLRAPRLLDGWMTGRRRERGYRALSRGMIAIGAGDVKRARKAESEARRLLTREPLTLLLTAQAAQLTGDATAARAAFEAMRAEPETRLIGLRGLYVEAERAGEVEAARHFAEEAARAAPSLAWAGEALFRYQAAAGDWHGALATLGSNLQAKLIDRTTAHRHRAVLLTGRGLDLEASDPEGAKTAVLEAIRLAPGLVPAATLAGRLFARQGDVKRASKILEAAWKQGPHPEIAEGYAEVRPGDAAADRLKRARRLAELKPGHVESQIALARTAIGAGEWQLARDTLAAVAEGARTERWCLLMAEIEEGAESNRGRVREWLARAVRAPRDAVWVADGYMFRAWAAVSPVTGRLDAFEWRVPTMEGEAPPAIEFDLPPEPETPAVAIPAASPASEEPAEVAPSEPPVPSPTVAAPPSPPVVPPPSAVPPPNGAAPAPDAELALPRPPDDPGVEDDPRTPSDRLRLQ